MAYNDFTLNQISKAFQLSIDIETDLFSSVKDIGVSPFLKETLKENVPLALAIHTQKACSEMIITPILIELRKLLTHQISLFSGVPFDVDRQKGLEGICDYIITLSKEQLYIKAPVIAVVTVGRNDIKSGFASCIAQMVALKTFNDKEENGINIAFGMVSSGSLWKFLKLEENLVYIDMEEYHIRQINKIMGILLQMIKMDHFSPCSPKEGA